MKNLTQLLKENSLVSEVDKCEHCGLRPKYKKRDWCERCIAQYRRRFKQTIKQKFKLITEQVGEHYVEAELHKLPNEIKHLLKDYEGLADLYLYGGVGTGKTYAMAALLKIFTFIGFNCIRINFDDFCVQVRGTFSPAAKQTEQDIVRPLIDCDMLFVDDLALRAKEESDFSYITLYTLINKRQERMLPTILSSNKSIEQLEQTFDSRIASRLKLAKEIKFTGSDRRR